tara:strand:+ start:3777 stop:3908 length:132 start_codon:yes stop_codon:yes gene_type:complete
MKIAMAVMVRATTDRGLWYTYRKLQIMEAIRAVGVLIEILIPS